MMKRKIATVFLVLLTATFVTAAPFVRATSDGRGSNPAKYSIAGLFGHRPPAVAVEARTGREFRVWRYFSLRLRDPGFRLGFNYLLLKDAGLWRVLHPQQRLDNRLDLTRNLLPVNLYTRESRFARQYIGLRTHLLVSQYLRQYPSFGGQVHSHLGSLFAASGTFANSAWIFLVNQEILPLDPRDKAKNREWRAYQQAVARAARQGPASGQDFQVELRYIQAHNLDLKRVLANPGLKALHAKERAEKNPYLWMGDFLVDAAFAYERALGIALKTPSSAEKATRLKKAQEAFSRALLRLKTRIRDLPPS